MRVGAFREVTFDADGVRAAVGEAHLASLCAGHFPDDPIVPGAYVTGLMADLGAVLLAQRHDARRFAAIERCTFLAPLRPTPDVVMTAVAAGESCADGVWIDVAVESGSQPMARARLRYA